MAAQDPNNSFGISWPASDDPAKDIALRTSTPPTSAKGKSRFILRVENLITE
jgi:hypothetical protein